MYVRCRSVYVAVSALRLESVQPSRHHYIQLAPLVHTIDPDHKVNSDLCACVCASVCVCFHIAFLISVFEHDVQLKVDLRAGCIVVQSRGLVGFGIERIVVIRELDDHGENYL